MDILVKRSNLGMTGVIECQLENGFSALEQFNKETKGLYFISFSLRDFLKMEKLLAFSGNVPQAGDFKVGSEKRPFRIQNGTIFAEFSAFSQVSFQALRRELRQRMVK